MLTSFRNFLARFKKPRMTTSAFVMQLYQRYGNDIADVMARSREYHVSTRSRLGLDGGSTGVPDCGFLHLLVKAFARKHVFELGTYIGSSAVTMAWALRAHGGRLTTCDPTDYKCIPQAEQDVIRYLNMSGDEGLQKLKDRGEKIDFVFADWEPTRHTIDLINDISTPDMIFSAHDYVLPDDKGVKAMKLVSRYYKRAHQGTWFLPEKQPILVAPRAKLQESVALWIPNHLLDKFQEECRGRLVAT